MNADKIVNGSFGYMYLNNIKVAEVMSFNAVVAVSREDVAVSGSNSMDTKLVSKAGSGTFKIRKVTDLLQAEKQLLLLGQDPQFSLRAYTKDPANGGTLEAVFPICKFDGDVVLVNFELETLGEEEVSFRFNDSTVIFTSANQGK